MTKEQDDIENRMRMICDFIIDSTAKVESGEMVNLSGLDDDVAALCERTIALPAAQATQIQPLMADMISNLDRLSNALRDYRDRAKNNPKG